jgi:hypothetical protein
MSLYLWLHLEEVSLPNWSRCGPKSRNRPCFNISAPIISRALPAQLEGSDLWRSHRCVRLQQIGSFCWRLGSVLVYNAFPWRIEPIIRFPLVSSSANKSAASFVPCGLHGARPRRGADRVRIENDQSHPLERESADARASSS